MMTATSKQESRINEADVSVRVAVRARPLVPKERAQGAQTCIAVDDTRKCVAVGVNRRFTFDYTFNEESSQDDVYNHCVRGLVESCFQGYNATVLAYGQTGSGKTYTMGTSNLGTGDMNQLGVAPRVIRHLFDGIKARQDSAAFQVRAQFLEIHNEELRDLLHPDIPSKGMAIRETAEGDIIVTGAKETVALSCSHLLHLLEAGAFSRATGTTLMNEQSSRSHAIFTIILEQHIFPVGQPHAAGAEYRCAKFHLVDLAGSERAKRSGAAGLRFKETVNINQGLLALGNVISALGDERKRGGHVPYRDSKLTRLLQDSLGGNSQTCMIACVSSADDSMEETMNTLKYANRARNIRNKPIVNREQKHNMETLKAEVQALQLALLKQVLDNPGCVPVSELLLADLTNPTPATLLHLRQLACLAAQPRDSACQPDQSQVLPQHIAVLEQEVATLRLQLQEAQAGQASLTEEAEALLTAQQGLQQQLQKKDAGTSQLLVLVPHLHLLGHITMDAHDRLLAAICSSGQIDGLTAVQPGPLRAAGGIEGSMAQNPCFSEGSSDQNGSESRMSLHSHPVVFCSVTGSMLGDRFLQAKQWDPQVRASMVDPDRARKLEAQLKEAQEALNMREHELLAAREDLQRDEVIFATRMRELRQIKHDLQELQAKHVNMLNTQEQREASLLNELQHWRHQALQAMDGQSTSDASQLPHGSLGHLSSQSIAKSGSCGSSERMAVDDQVLYDDDLLSYISDTDYADLRSDLWPEPDSALQEQLQRAALEKAVAEEERVVAEAAVAAQEADFAAAREVLAAQLDQLAEGIKGKEAVIAQLAISEADARAQSAQLLERMQQLEADIDGKQAELGALRQELVELENSSRQRSEEEQHTLRKQYEGRIQAVMSQMTCLKKQLKDQEAIKADKERQRSQARLQQMQEELARMRSQQEDLRKRMAQKTVAYERQVLEQQKELSQLRRMAEAAQKKAKELEEETTKQKLALRQKHEEGVALQRRLRSAETETAKRTLKEDARSSSVPRCRKASGQIVKPSIQRQQQQWIEHQLLVIMQQKETEARLAALQVQKATLTEQQQELADQHSQIQLRSLRRMAAGDACTNSTASVEPGSLLTSSGQHLCSSEMDEVEDALDNLAAKMEYLTNQELEVQQALSQAKRAGDAIRRRAAGMTADEARCALSATLTALARHGEKQQEIQSKLMDSESLAHDIHTQLEAAHSTLQMKEVEFDRRLKEVQAEHSRKVQSLLRQMKHLMIRQGYLPGGSTRGPPAHPLSVTSSLAVDNFQDAPAELPAHPLPKAVVRHLQMRRSQPAGWGSASESSSSSSLIASGRASDVGIHEPYTNLTLKAGKATRPHHQPMDVFGDVSTSDRSSSDSDYDSSPPRDQPLAQQYHGSTTILPTNPTSPSNLHGCGQQAARSHQQQPPCYSPKQQSPDRTAQGAASPATPNSSQDAAASAADSTSPSALQDKLSPYKKLMMRQASNPRLASSPLRLAAQQSRAQQ